MKSVLDWFELPVVDLDRASRFYEQVLQGTVTREELGGELNGNLPYIQPGVGGALVLREGFTPGQGALIYFNVSGDLEGAVERAKQAGATVLVPPTPPAVFGRIAVLIDPEGNRIGLHTD